VTAWPILRPERGVVDQDELAAPGALLQNLPVELGLIGVAVVVG
jgi:hypothetical protein